MKMESPVHPPKRKIWGMHPNIFFLGMVSFLTDVSSEMIFGPLFPLFLANVLGVKTTIIGLIAGVTEGTESILKIFSGWISDRVGKRKVFALLGYGLSTIAKPFMYLTAAWGQVLGVRFVDRLGKGLRTSPRDALVAASSLPEERGRSFGFHRAMDTGGAVVGLGAAAVVVFLLQREMLQLTQSTYQRIVLIGVVPAVLAVLLLFFFVQERQQRIPQEDALNQQLPKAEGGFSTQFKIFLAIMFIFTLGNSSDAFLSLRVQNLGYSLFHIILMFILFNIIYASTSLPAGMLSDKLGRKRVIAMGWLIYALVYFGLAHTFAPWQAWLLFATYGLYYGLSDGVARAFIADMVAEERRGTAYGLYHGTIGFGLLAANLIAGWLWQTINPAAPFFFGAGMAAAAMVALITLIR
jgi:MFS family permease